MVGGGAPKIGSRPLGNAEFSWRDIVLLQQSIGRLHSLTSISMSSSSEEETRAVVKGLAALPPESLRNILSTTTCQRLTDETEDSLLALILKHRLDPFSKWFDSQNGNAPSFVYSIETARKEECRKRSCRILLYRYSYSLSR
jgi:hypothetical protein